MTCRSSPAPDMLFELLSYLTGGAQRQKARALAQGEDPGRRCRNPRRYGRAAEILRRAAAPRSLRRGARAAAAPALFDLVVAQARPGKLSLTVDACATWSASAGASASPRAFSPSVSSGATRSRLCAEGAWLCVCRGSDNTDHHDRARHRHGAVPCFPARARRTGAPARTGCSSAISAAPAISSTDEFNAMKTTGTADAVIARLVARRRQRSSTCRIACVRSAANCGRGSPGAPTSTSAVTPSAWPRMSSARWSTSWPNSARGRPMKAVAFLAELKKRAASSRTCTETGSGLPQIQPNKILVEFRKEF